MNIARHVERGAKSFPNHPAILFEGTCLTYSELNKQANRITNALKAHGIKRGDRVALYLPNIPAFVICYLAVMKAGGIAVSINSMFKSDEVKYLVNDSESKIIFTVGDFVPNIPREECPSLSYVVVCEGDAQGNETLDHWMIQAASDAKAMNMDRNDPAVLLYTSGTTGFPKGATLSHGNIISNIESTVHHAGYSHNDRMLLFLPLFHVFGQNFIMNATFSAASTLVMHRRFVLDLILDSVQRHQVTMFFAVPTIYINLLNTDLSQSDISTIRYYFSAAATMPEEISRRWTDRFGQLVYEGYGLTESSPFACYNHDSHYKFGSVGTAIKDFELKILDSTDNELPVGEWGEICIKGPGVMLGYWGKSDESERALRNGWLHSGDIGVMDDEGYVYIVDRVKDMINAAGFKIWPAEIEQFLYRHAAIKEIAVYGVPDPIQGEIVQAAIVLKQGASTSSEEIIAFCRERIAAYKIPAKVEFMNELPKSATGKILKRVLRA
ncbi:MAG TPA: long-chain fatty acid--CoA ligase, partial [Acidobacteriota bacterium]|nr:long-chain fatty acid--CoA ligase [Acidobacteriota bacterium]